MLPMFEGSCHDWRLQLILLCRVQVTRIQWNVEVMSPMQLKWVFYSLRNPMNLDLHFDNIWLYLWLWNLLIKIYVIVLWIIGLRIVMINRCWWHLVIFMIRGNYIFPLSTTSHCQHASMNWHIDQKRASNYQLYILCPLLSRNPVNLDGIFYFWALILV
jgi:hypothetical protein